MKTNCTKVVNIRNARVSSLLIIWAQKNYAFVFSYLPDKMTQTNLLKNTNYQESQKIKNTYLLDQEVTLIINNYL